MRFGIALWLLSLSAALALLRPDPPPRLQLAEQPASTAQAQAWLDRELAPALRWQGVPGVALALRDGQGGLMQWQAGSIAALSPEPIGPRTRFEAASLSKPLTAYAALRLVEQGKLRLDAPLERGGQRFTLRQLLSHQAGFDNSLQPAPQPVQAAGSFRYAGSGYLLVGELIAQASGQDFQTHMNAVVLPELGMADSRFGAGPAADAVLAQPSIDLGLPLAALLLMAALLALPLQGLIGWRRPGWRLWALPAALTLGLSAGTALVVLALGWRVAAGCWAALLPGLGACWLLGRSKGHGAVALLALASVWFALLWARPALPLAERKPMALPAAGLRTTATDYARFLSQLLEKARREPLWAQMLEPQLHLNEQQAWGLGLGLQQRGGRLLAWHWGVNFPGYQALAVADVHSGRVLVLLMNGGTLSRTPQGAHYGGLELARQTVARLMGGEQGGYWRELP